MMNHIIPPPYHSIFQNIYPCLPVCVLHPLSVVILYIVVRVERPEDHDVTDQIDVHILQGVVLEVGQVWTHLYLHILQALNQKMLFVWHGKAGLSVEARTFCP